MNTLQTIWSALTTENEILFKILSIPLAFLDVYIGLLFFTTILNIPTTRKRKILYVIIYGTVSNIITFLVPPSYKIYVIMIIWPILIYFLLKTSILKSIFSLVVTLIITSILESVFINIFKMFAGISFQEIVNIPLYRIASALSIYGFIYLLSKLIKYFKININFLENLSVRNKLLLYTSIFLIVLVLCMQFGLLIFYSNTMPLIVSVTNIIILIIYFSISICSIINISKLELTKIDLESANHTIQTTKILHDQVRSFKHDFDNIVNGIGGYIINDDMQGLKRYYNQLLEECNKTNNLYALSPDVINHPAIYHLLATKYYEADKLDVDIKLNVFLNLNEIEDRMKIYDFTRIFGILLDNAIDAAKECDKKILDVTFRKELSNNMILVIIQNTYSNKDVNTEEIFQKGISSKENHSGLGLWKVRQILMHNNNLNLYTTKNDEFFTQQFEIYK